MRASVMTLRCSGERRAKAASMRPCSSCRIASWLGVQKVAYWWSRLLTLLWFLRGDGSSGTSFASARLSRF